MPINYKDLREQLDDILYDLDVPKEYFHRLADLNRHLADHVDNKDPKVQKAFEIIHKISPVQLIHFENIEQRNDSTNNSLDIPSEI
jgi:hypothetical protein